METKSTDSKVTRRKVSWEEIFKQLDILYSVIKKDRIVYGIPKNGMILAGILCNIHRELILTHQVEDANFILDDIVASGRTREKYKALNPEAQFYSLYDSLDEEFEGVWLEFPWEDTQKDAEELVVRQLEYIGEDVKRSGLIDTPKRVVKMWDEIFSGYNAEVNVTTFVEADTDEMIILDNIDFYSTCEHHLLPFFGKVAIGYIPNVLYDYKEEKLKVAGEPFNILVKASEEERYCIIGVSKLIRVVDMYSRRLQIQERMTAQIAKWVEDMLHPLGVGVVIKAQHLCMMMRGVKSHNSMLTTSSMLGVFRDDSSVKNEFLNRII